MPHPAEHLSAIVVAGGSSSRMKSDATPQNKLLLPFGTSTVIGTVLTRLAALPFREIVMVTGAYHAELVAYCSTEQMRTVCPRLRIVYNRHHSNGMATSLAQGVRACSVETQGVLIALGDMPCVRQCTIELLCTTFEELSRQAEQAENKSTSAPIVMPCYGTQRGNPVLFAAAYIPELSALQGDTGGKPVVMRHADHLHEIATDDEGILTDVDTHEAYIRALERYR